MISKVQEKHRAITLRKQGKTYSEILDTIKVSRSTLSLWLREVGLSIKQEQLLTEKKRQAQMRGAQSRFDDRVLRTKVIVAEAQQMVGKLSSRERLLIGTALYWAEGAKEKTHRPSVALDFANSDPEMIRFHVLWLKETLKVPLTDIFVILHLHKNRVAELTVFLEYWSNITGIPLSQFAKPVIKKYNPKTRRKNSGSTYHGLVAIRVRRSTMLNRRVYGWICGIISAQ